MLSTLPVSLITAFIFSHLNAQAAETSGLALSLRQAEQQAMTASNQLRAIQAEEQAASEQAEAVFQNLLPKLTFQANYTYFAAIPTLTTPAFGSAGIPFGTHGVYTLGPQLNYTLWDFSSQRKSYQAASLLKTAREEDRKTAEKQLLAAVRGAYVQVQLGIEELKLINDSLDHAKAQNRDVAHRFQAGAADQLDRVTSHRSVLNYQIEFEQRQAQLSSSLRDLLNLLGDDSVRDISRPGPSGIPGVTLALTLESLKELTSEIPPPSTSSIAADQPQIRGLELQSQSLELGSESQSAKQLPLLQMSASVSNIRPNMPNPSPYWQESVGVSLVMPLYLGDSSRHLAAQQLIQADAVRFRAAQLKADLSRDFAKANELLASLHSQKKLSDEDVAQSEEQAQLYFTSYKAGKINFIDVQNANLQALQAKVRAARIDAQILNQLILLKTLSAEEISHGK